MDAFLKSSGASMLQYLPSSEKRFHIISSTTSSTATVSITSSYSSSETLAVLEFVVDAAIVATNKMPAITPKS